MKRILILIVALLQILWFSSCSKGTSDISQNDSTESESPPSLDSDCENEMNFNRGDLQLGYFVYDYNREDYDRWVRPDLFASSPQNFMHYREIERGGQAELILFEEFGCDSQMFNPIYTRYRTTFKLIYEENCWQNIHITVLHGDLSEPNLTEEVKKDALERGALPAIYFREDNPVVTDHEGNDMRYYNGQRTVDYFCNGIRYTYEVGKLTEIHWRIGDSEFWFTFEEPLYDGAMEHPLLSPFLNKDQTATAIAWFDAIITADEAQ